MTLSERLRQAVAPIWQKTLTHPFVTGLGDGALPLENFRFYMGQDYVFLIEYSRLLALATAKAPDLDTMGRFANLLDATLNREMALHREFAALATWLRELLDSLAGTASEERLVEIFRTSARYEYLFWEMAYRLERWPV